MGNCHSASAAERRSWLKWLWTLAWTEANFWRVFIRRKRSIARSRLRNDRWPFSTRLALHNDNKDDRYVVVHRPAATAHLGWGADRQVMTIDRGKRGAGENPNQPQLMARRPTLDPDQPSLLPLRQTRPPGASHVRGEAFRKQYSQAHLDCALTKPILQT